MLPACPPLVSQVRIRVVAVGGAGIRLTSHLVQQVPELSYAAVETDLASLDPCSFPLKRLVGRGTTGGMGSGSNPDLARRCAEAQSDELDAVFEGADLLVLVCGLGGGTGGGIGPWLAERAKTNGQTVLAAVVRPFEMEGGHRRHVADTALSRFRSLCDGVFLFPLEALREERDIELPLPQVLLRCTRIIGRSLGALAILLRTSWMIPLTVRDLIELLHRAEGACRLVAVSADGPDRVPAALDELFSHPLLDRGSLLAQSGGIAVGFLAGPETTVRELEGVMAEIQSVVRADAEVKLGVAIDARFGERLAMVVLVTERWARQVVPVLDAAPATDSAAAQSAPAPLGSLVQVEIPLEGLGRGDFAAADPTVFAGENLDEPTFVRRGIKLSRSRR